MLPDGNSRVADCQQNGVAHYFQNKKEEAGMFRVSVVINGIYKNSGLMVGASSPCKARVSIPY